MVQNFIFLVGTVEQKKIVMFKKETIQNLFLFQPLICIFPIWTAYSEVCVCQRRLANKGVRSGAPLVIGQKKLKYILHQSWIRF
jgi:hypothetical protein